MACYNHPNAATVANCKSCGLEMCGICTQFLDSGEYCEKCAQAIQAEDFVVSQSHQIKKQESGAASSKLPQEQFEEPNKGKDKYRGIILLAVGGSLVIVFFSLLLYAFPHIFEFDAEAAAAREAAYAFESCWYTFQEIGMILEEGQMPDPSLRCEESNTPNIVTRDGDTIRISHPDPGFHGFSEIFVTNNSHEPTFVD